MPLKVSSVSVQGPALRITTEEGLAGLGPLPSAYTAADFQETSRKLAGVAATAWASVTMPASLAGSVNCALLDIVGKYAQAPVYQVLGGPTRFKVRVMARVEELGAVPALWQQGHRAFCLPVGKPETLVARLQDLRKKLPLVDFVVDARNNRLPPGQAMALAAELLPLHPLWFNDACAPRNIASETVTPLGFTSGSNTEMLKVGAIDVVRPSMLRDGIQGSRKIAALAEVYYVAAAPQFASTHLEVMAALQFAASIPNFFILELPVDSPLPVRDGYVDLPTTPGIGVQA